ncbi:MAG: Ig-like domain-containing protein [Caldilineaceae bacterium]
MTVIRDDALLAALVEDADHGTVTLQTDGAFVYTSVADFQGEDRFKYQAFGATTASAIATVTVTVRREIVHRSPRRTPT